MYSGFETVKSPKNIRYFVQHLHQIGRYLGIIYHSFMISCNTPGNVIIVCTVPYRRYFEHAYFIPIVGMRKIGEY